VFHFPGRLAAAAEEEASLRENWAKAFLYLVWGYFGRIVHLLFYSFWHILSNSSLLAVDLPPWGELACGVSVSC
jgi:hypothetical protein